jgi:hypothetical protein
MHGILIPPTQLRQDNKSGGETRSWRMPETSRTKEKNFAYPAKNEALRLVTPEMKEQTVWPRAGGTVCRPQPNIHNT